MNWMIVDLDQRGRETATSGDPSVWGDGFGDALPSVQPARPSVHSDGEPNKRERKTMVAGSGKEEVKIDGLEERSHVLSDHGRVEIRGDARLHGDRRAPNRVLASPIGAASEKGLVVSILPSLGVRATGAHANPVIGGSQNEIAIAALLLGDEGGEGFLNGLRKNSKQLGGLPEERKT